MTKLFNFTQAHYSSLCKQKIPLDCMFILEMIKEEQDIDNEEFLPFIQRLQRKGYIDIHNNLTSYGEELYESMKNEVVTEVKTRKRPRVNGEKFDEWWETYPATNNFTIQNTDFKGTQNKRIKKDECKRLFNVMCSSEFDPDDVILATKHHLQTAMELSLKRRENQVSFIPNSERYLRERYFEPYIKLYKEKQKTAKSGGDFEI